MRSARQKLHGHHLRSVRRISNPPAHALSAVESISGPLDHVDITKFRQLAFQPEKPLLITGRGHSNFDSAPSNSSIPAMRRWFTREGSGGGQLLNQPYLERFAHVVLPYELLGPRSSDDNNDEIVFERFHAPLELFLNASRLSKAPQLYIAQAQLQDLPRQLRDDLPTPLVVLNTGKGDVYDVNIWMGIPPTYTPLHKDPNPNLFVQLASNKIVRLFRPDVGAAMFQVVQEKVGRHTSSVFRGGEMMQGPERKALEVAVWHCAEGTNGYETIVQPGDGLFIPKGWWHSIKSVGGDITASVNWWFR